MTTLPYVVDGDGTGPHLVMAHGLMGTGAQQRAQLPPLVDAGWTVVTFDQRGHGGAPPVTDTDGYDPDAMGDDLWAIVDVLGIERCWIGGGSMGAATSWCAARAQPARVEGLIHVVPALRDEPHPAIFLFDALAAVVASDGIPGLIGALRQLIATTGGAAADATFLHELETHDAASIECALRAVPRWILEDVPNGFKDVPFPVVVIGWGDDPIHPLQTARDVADAAGVELVQIEQPTPGVDDTKVGRLLVELLRSQ